MYISVACFSELLEIICAILKLAEGGKPLDEATTRKLEQKALDFVHIAVDAYKHERVHAAS
ncbi:MAG: hypothetical protein FWF83_01950 [Clostridiales bacterium]|nr:hypothetical protein [Clostridiales bacterium]